MGMRTVNDPNASLNPLIDKIIGNAFPIVQEVSLHLEEIKYLVDNMAAIIQVGQAEQNLIDIAASAPLALANAAATVNALAQATALLHGVLIGLDASGALVTPTGSNTPSTLANVAASLITEIATRGASDSALTSSINAVLVALSSETTARISAVTAEISRAITAENANTTAISAEVTARATAISTEVTARNTAIGVETTRATTAEATKQAVLGFTPVQQGTGVGQSSGNLVKLGYDGISKTKLTIDSTDQGNIALEPWVTTAIGVETSARIAAVSAITTPTRFTLLPAGATHPPTTRGDFGDGATAFTGDLTQVGWEFGYRISGSTTLGNPTSGYLYTPEVSMYFDYFLNESGWNQGTADNNGRTAATSHFTRIDQQGQGDCMGYVVLGRVTSTKSGGTSWLASPAISAYDADFTAAASHAYLNPRETNMNDGGFDCAAIGDVTNMWRTVHTAAQGDPWIGYRIQSVGSQEIDAGWSLSGKATIGLDLTTAIFGTQQAAITLAMGQRLYFQAVNSDSLALPRGTNPTGAYIACDPTGLGSLVLNGTPGGGGAVEINLTGGPLVTVVGELLVVGGACLSASDNAYSIGGSSNRWSELFSGSGTINTSDANEKTLIENIPEALLDAWDAISPRTYKMIDAVSRKGDAARHHTGYVAQEFASALTASGLVPAEWGSWCNDVLTTGGSRQGLRYDEMFTIADAANRRKLSRLEARITALELS